MNREDAKKCKEHEEGISSNLRVLHYLRGALFKLYNKKKH
jgi:hypothetical protein